MKYEIVIYDNRMSLNQVMDIKKAIKGFIERHSLVCKIDQTQSFYIPSCVNSRNEVILATEKEIQIRTHPPLSEDKFTICFPTEEMKILFIMEEWKW